MTETTHAPAPQIEAANPVSKMANRGFFYAAATVAAAILLAPIVLSVVLSFLGGLPDRALTLQNYINLDGAGSGIWTYSRNSMIVALSTALLVVVVSTLAGFALSRLRFPGSNVVFLILLTPFMVPFQGILTPLFLVLSYLRLNDSLVGLVLVYSTFQLPFAIFIMRNSFSQVPLAVEEAAMIDGASTLQILVRIMWPFAVPGAVTAAMFAFLFGWNEFLAALTVLVTDSKYTLPIALNNLQVGAYGEVDFGLLDAGAVIAMVPCIILFLILQRYYIGGLTAGSVKM